MDSINKTLYIPLYGKSYVSKQNIILKDLKAEEIWDKVQFKLKSKSKSKWLAYFLAMRAKVFDEWTLDMLNKHKDATVIQIGVGLDSRILRINNTINKWYDLDLPDVITERGNYYKASDNYIMKSGDAKNPIWLKEIEYNKEAIVVIEGLSMYITNEDLNNLFKALSNKFKNLYLLMDAYTMFGAKMTKIKNPINDVGVKDVYGLDDYNIPSKDNDIKFIRELSMTPNHLVDELKGFDKKFFSMMFAGKIARKMYRLLEYSKTVE